MDKSLEAKMQESEKEWADIDKLCAIREKKDKRIISEYCADNDAADVVHTVELLEKHSGLPEHDRETVAEFKQAFPKDLTVPILHRFLDVVDIYSKYLEYGEENQ